MKTIRVLSIQNPWAGLILDRYKTIELRTWQTTYRGRIYIHATGNGDRTVPRDVYIGSGESYLIPLVCSDQNRYSPGWIHGYADLADIKTYLSSEKFNWDKPLHRKAHYTGKYPLYGWILENIVVLPDDEAIETKGKLGLWRHTIEG